MEYQTELKPTNVLIILKYISLEICGAVHVEIKFKCNCVQAIEKSLLTKKLLNTGIKYIELKTCLTHQMLQYN